MTRRATSINKIIYILLTNFARTLIHSVHVSVSELPSAEYVKKAFISKCKLEKSAVVVQVLGVTQNFIISRCCFAEDGYEMYQDYDARAEAIVQLIKPFVYCDVLDFSLPSSSWLRKLPHYYMPGIGCWKTG